MGYNLLINGVYWGYNPLTNHLLTSWDIQVRIFLTHLSEEKSILVDQAQANFYLAQVMQLILGLIKTLFWTQLIIWSSKTDSANAQPLNFWGLLVFNSKLCQV